VNLNLAQNYRSARVQIYADYDAMDFTEVNTAFASEAIALAPAGGLMLDMGTGTARIPILIAQQAPEWQIQAIDLADHMLQIGHQHILAAGLQAQITLARDCKLFCVSGLKYIQIEGDRHEKTDTAPVKSRPVAGRINAGLQQS
jgi:tRNA1(Val) A37 N6-methylase TrmN6